jgi:predicted ATPase
VVATNVAPPPEPLVGRSADLAAILGKFAEDERLLTITGPAGVGKTRLAIEVGLALAAEGRAEVWRAELGEARGAEGICDAVALALGMVREPSRDAADAVLRIGRALAARGEVALILDEMDALVAHAAETVGRFLSLAPEAIFVVTSRERLGIAGEQVHELAPLALPEGAGAEGEAVELFVRAVRRVRGDYTLSAAEAPFVAAIVRELSGLPLAIELAAPRMALMGARALLHRLGSRFDVLRRGGAGAAGRHATLEAAIDGSWSALAPWERDALAQCSVFRGGFTLEAAEAVIDVRAHAGAPATLDVLAALRDKSLLYAFAPRAALGEVRLGMYAAIRAFAADRLDEAATRAAEARHAAHVVSAAEAWSKRLTGRDGPEMRARVLAERENLLAVIERVLGRGPVSARAAEPALRALLVLAPALLHEGALDAYVRLLDPVLEATRDSGADPRLSAHALAVRGSLLRQRGQSKAGSRDLVRALASAKNLGDRALEARVTHELGHALASRGEAAAAGEHFERALAICREIGDRSGAGDALASLGALTARQGRLDEAAPLVERALAVHRAEQSPLAEAADLRSLGEIALDAGRLDEARVKLGEALLLARQIRDRRGEALAIGLSGRADHLAEDHARARAAYEGASAILRDLGFAPLEALFTGWLGELAREEDRTAEAFTLLTAARDLLGEETDVARAAIFLAHEGALDAGVGRDADACVAFTRAREKAQKTGDPDALAVVAVLSGSEAAGDARTLASRSAEVRVALRCVDRAATSRASKVPPPPDDALLVGPAGQWFRAPHGERVPLDRRKPLALMLDRLARERAESPGNALAWDALLAAGWPGERVQAAAGAHRVRVAISTLRKLGLKDVLATRGEGYLLAPEIPAIRLV